MKHLRFRILLIVSMMSFGIVKSQSTLLSDLEIITSSNLDQLEQIMMFNRGTIEEMSWSPDGNKLAVGGSAGGWIYDAKNLQAKPIHFADFMRLKDLEFHPSGEKIISTGEGGSVYEWNSQTGELIREIAPEPYNLCPNCKASISTVKYSPDGNYIVIGSTNDVMLLLEYETGNVLATLSDPRPYEIFFSPNGEYIAAHDSVYQNQISIWLLSSILNGQTEPDYMSAEVPFSIWNIAWMPDSQGIILAPFSADSGNLYLFDISSRTSTPFGIGHHVVTTSSDYVVTRYSVFDDEQQRWVGYIDFLDLSTGKLLWQFAVVGGVTDLRFSPSQQYLAIGFENGSLQIVDVSLRQEIAYVIGTGAMITAIALLNDNYLVSMETERYDISTLFGGGACGDNILRLWDLKTAEEIRSWRSDTAEFGNFACGRLATLPISQQIILQFGSEMIVLDPFTEEFFSLVIPFKNDRFFLQFLFFNLSADQSYLGIHAMSFYDFDEFFVWDVSSGLSPDSEAIQVIVPPAQRLFDFVFSADNQSLIISNNEGELTTWDISSGEQQQNIEWEVPAWFSTIDLAISPDTSIIAVNASEIHLLDAIDYDLIDIWDDEEFGTGEGIQYGTRNDWFVTHRRYDTFRFWVSESNTPLYLPATADSIAFSSDGTFFVTGGVDGIIRIWGIPIPIG